jgi:hypothetical protein
MIGHHDEGKEVIAGASTEMDGVGDDSSQAWVGKPANSPVSIEPRIMGCKPQRLLSASPHGW